MIPALQKVLHSPFFPTGSSMQSFIQKIYQALKTISPAWRYSLLIFLSGRILFSIWGAIIWSFNWTPEKARFYYYDILPIKDGLAGALLGVWQRWDGIYYQQIATYGYRDPQSTVFFPLFPLLARLVSAVTKIEPLVALMIVGNAAFLVSLWLLYQVVSDHFSPRLARATLFTLIIFPSSVYFYSIYPQSLLFMLILLSYWLAYRGKWAGAGAAGFFAGLTHATSIVLTPLLFIQAVLPLIQKKGRLDYRLLSMSVMNILGILAFFLWRKVSGFQSFQQLQKEGWNVTVHMPWDGAVVIVRYILSLKPDYLVLIDWIYTALFLVIIFIIARTFRKIPAAMWIYQASFMVLIFSMYANKNYPLLGLLRYSLIMFPLFLGIAYFGQTKFWKLLKLFVFLSLNLILSAMFFSWSVGFS